jgi:hypothetical protein
MTALPLAVLRLIPLQRHLAYINLLISLGSAGFRVVFMVLQIVTCLSLGSADFHVVITRYLRFSRGHYVVMVVIMWLSLGSAGCHVVITW